MNEEKRKAIIALKAQLEALEIIGETYMGWFHFRKAARYHSIVDQFRTLVYDLEG